MDFRLNHYRNFIASAIFSLLWFSGFSQAPIKIWTGAAGNNNWGTAGNWSPAVVPTPADSVVFVGVNNIDCIINVAAFAFWIKSSGTYSKNITQQGTNTITISTGGGMELSSGLGCNFIGGSGDITINGVLRVQNGSNFTSTTKTLRVRDGFDFRFGSTFYHNSGRVIFTYPQNIYGDTEFYILDFSPTGGASNFNLNSDSLIVHDTLFFSNAGPLSLTNGDVWPLKDVVVTNSYNGNGGNGAIQLGKPGTQTIWGITGGLGGTIGLGGLNSIVIRKPAADAVIFKGTVNISRGNHYYPMSGVITTTGARLVLSGQTYINGGSSFPYIENLILYPLHQNFDNTGNNFITVQNLTYAAGPLYIALNTTIGTGAIHVKDSLIIQNTTTICNKSPGPIIMNGPGNQHIIGNSVLGSGIIPTITINKPGTTVFLHNNISFGFDWNLQNGIVDPGTSSVAFMGENHLRNPNGMVQHFNNLYLWGCSGALDEFYFDDSPTTVHRNLYIEGSLIHQYYNNSVHVEGDIFLNNTGFGGYGTTVFHVDGTGGTQIMDGNRSVGRGRLPNVIINKLPGDSLIMKDTISISGNWEYQRGTVEAIIFNSYVAFYNDSTLDGQGITDTMLFNKIRTGDNKTRRLLGYARVKNLVQLDSGKINLNSHVLRVENTSPTAITRTSGYIICERTTQPYGGIQWNIQNSGLGSNYVFPFGKTSATPTYLPFHFNVQAAGVESVVPGHLLVSTYETDPTPIVNNRPLPAGVTNTQDQYGLDNNCRLVDRWWMVDANNYTTKPRANLIFTYADFELAGTNCLNEAVLKTQRWNSNTSFWDYPGGTVNTAGNTVTVTNVDTFSVFTLLDPNPPALAITVTDSILCAGDTVDYCISINVPANSYTWTFQGGTPSSGSIACPQNIVYNTPGTYDVTITAAFTNVTITTVYPDYITVNPPITVTPAVTNVTCNGLNNGSITATVSPGTPGEYTYLWSPGGATTPTISSLTPTTFTVTVSDTLGACSKTATATVTQPTVLNAVWDSTRNVTCNLLANGYARVTASGGNGGYTHSWSNGTITNGAVSSVNNLASGTTYADTIRDSNGCQKIVTGITVTQPTALVLTTNKVDVSCGGANDGKADVDVTGGTSGYTYGWAGGPFTPFAPGDSIHGLSPLTYTVTVTDANACTATASVTISEISPMVLQLTTYDVNCNGDSSGAAKVRVVSGGTGPFTSFNWSRGISVAPGDTVRNLTAGAINVTVTDANGCTATASGTINQPPVLSVSITKTDITCNGLNNGKAKAIPVGGNGGNGYVWSNSAQQVAGRPDSVINLSAQTYTVTVTDSKGCTATASTTITQPAAMILTMAQRPVSCNGGNDGCAWVSVSGGNGPYSYVWNPVGANNDTICSLTAILVSVTVTDINGCTATSSITVTQPTAISLTINKVDVSCGGANDGKAWVVATGGTQLPGPDAYTYSWTGSSSTNDTITGLSPNTYTVIVTDSHSCTATANAVITEIPPITPTSVITHVACNNGSNGAINLSITGGTPNYSYLWSNDSTTQDLTGLTAGIYSVIITDTNNCSETAAYSVLTGTSFGLSANVVNATCGNSDGAIDLSVVGGSGRYSYNWSNTATTQDISSLNPDTFKVTVTDSTSGCIENLTSIVKDVGGPTVTGVVVNASNCSATDGTITLTVTGTGPFIYSWSHGPSIKDVTTLSSGNYAVTVTDSTTSCTTIKSFTVGANSGLTFSAIKTNASCGGSDGAINLTVLSGGGGYLYNWSTGATTQNITGLGMGTYTLTVTDVNGCTGDSLFIINEAGSPAILGVVTNVSCFGGSNGSINITANGGSGSFIYAWSNSANTRNISGLLPGTYIVTVSDSVTRCSIAQFYDITEPPPLTLTADKSNVTCGGLSNGSIDLTVSGGTLAYVYGWSNGATSQDISNLAIGNYCLTVTDSKGCTSTLCITIEEPAVLTATAFMDSVNCIGGNDGFAWVVPSGGSPDYGYTWAGFPGVNNDTITGLVAGSISVTVTDAAGCTATASITVREPSAISLTVTKVDISCFGLTDGKAFVSASGGTPAYTYGWSAGTLPLDRDSTIGLSAGVVIVTVTDANSCQAVDSSITIVEPSDLTLAIDSSNISCNGGSDGKAWVVATGGTPSTPGRAGYTYVWSPLGVPTSPVADTSKNQSAGIVKVIVSDSRGCSDSASVNIQDPPAITTVMDVVNNICFGESKGKAWVVASGGTPSGVGTGYTYNWSNGTFPAPGDTAYNLPAGFVKVTVVDNNNCLHLDSIEITEPTVISLVMDSSNIACNGETNGKAHVTATGGTPYMVAPSYTYLWSTGPPNDLDSIVNVGAGFYTVTVSDSNLCQVTGSVNIVEPPVIILEMDSQNISCFGLIDGIAWVVASGGTPSVAGAGGYTYNWNPAGTSSPLFGDSTFNQGAGVVMVTVTDSRSCQDSASINIVEPDSILLTIAQTNVNCFGGSDGTATVTASGGTPGFTYLWSNTDTSNSTYTGLLAGQVVVTVTDSRNCFDTISTIITEPATPISTTMTKVDVSCFGLTDGKAIVTASGGTPKYYGYDYTWLPAGTGAANVDSAEGLGAGDVIVTVIDSNNCMLNDTITIVQPDELLLTIVVDSNANCNGGTNGGLTVSLTGGVPNYDYEWSNLNSTLGTPQISNSINGLSVGTYDVTVTDANGCSTQISEDITERPGPAVSNTIVVSSTCDRFDGSITVVATSNDEPITYAWQHSPPPQGPVADNLFRGDYTVTVSDASTCDTVITVTVNEIPGPQAALGTVKDSYCDNNDGLAIVVTTGGVPPYTYSWSHNDSLTDSIATNLTPQPAGYYAVTVSDANGCDTVLFFDIINIAAPAITMDPVSPQTIFIGQALPLDVTETRGFNVTYAWTPATGLDCEICEDPIATPVKTITYLVVATDTSTQCTDSLYMTVIVKDEKNIFVPNVISPNGDGLNEVWNIDDLKEIFLDNEVAIVNRWGDEVFRAKPYMHDWGGTYKNKPLPDGTYYYIIKLNNINKVISGTITIVN